MNECLKQSSPSSHLQRAVSSNMRYPVLHQAFIRMYVKLEQRPIRSGRFSFEISSHASKLCFPQTISLRFRRESVLPTAGFKSEFKSASHDTTTACTRNFYLYYLSIITHIPLSIIPITSTCIKYLLTMASPSLSTFLAKF